VLSNNNFSVQYITPVTVQMIEFNIKVPKGKYVVAVSGGVDSMVLLDILSKQNNLDLVVAHANHSIRPDSKEDELLVKKVASQLGLKYVSKNLKLNESTSEADARDARYEFLVKTMEANNAKAIITAHHQNDQIETAVFNILRGTGRKGLSSLKSTKVIIRPLLKISKDQIYEYASANNLLWREDSTNLDTKYARNYIRHKLLTKLPSTERKELVSSLNKIEKTNDSLDRHLESYVNKNSKNNSQLSRAAFVILPHKVAKEIMATWLRQNGIRDFDSSKIETLTVVAKTLEPGKQVDVNQAKVLYINKDSLVLKSRER
jgi:tRNA(Ile)-lysidine synthetase-like protein